MSESGLYAQVRALADNQADHHSRVYEELKALRESNLSLHGLVARVDERQQTLAEKLEVWARDADARLDTHSERMDGHAAEASARIDALEKIEARRKARVELFKQASSFIAAGIGIAATLATIAAAVAAWGQ